MNRIRDLREAKGLSQAELGKLVGLNQSAIQKLESEATVLTVPRAVQIAEALGCEPYEVMGLKIGKEA